MLSSNVRSLLSFISCSGEQGQNIFYSYHNLWYHGYSLLECIESIVSALDYKEDLNFTSRGQNNIHKTKIKQGRITLGQDIVVCPGKTMMVKRIKSTGKKKSLKKRFLVKSDIASCIIKSHEKICNMGRFTVRNGSKAYGKILGD